MFRLNHVSFRAALPLVVAFAVFTPTRPATAQRAGDGSVYSRFGIGELRSFGSQTLAQPLLAWYGHAQRVSIPGFKLRLWIGVPEPW